MKKTLLSKKGNDFLTRTMYSGLVLVTFTSISHLVLEI